MKRRARDDKIISSRQGFFADAFKRFSAHDYRASHGEALKVFEVCRGTPRKLIVLSHHTVSGCGHNVVELHLIYLHRDRRFNGRVRIVIFNFEVGVFKFEDVFDSRTQTHGRQQK